MSTRTTRTRTTVYECGGRGGMHRSWQRFPGLLNYVSFDPEVKAYDGVLEDAGPDTGAGSRMSIERIGLSDRPGTERLNVYNHRDLSSFFELDQPRTHRYRRQEVHLEEVIEVACDTLDGVASRRGEAPDFLCMDTQGAELAILRGAERILKESVIGLRCEVEFIPLYRNQPLFSDVDRHLANFGFELLRFEKCGSGVNGISTDAGPFSLSVDDAVPAWADAIFARVPAVDDAGLGQGPEHAGRVLKFVLFTISNQCGSSGMNLLSRLAERDRLAETLGPLDRADRQLLVAEVGSYLDRVERTDWQTDPSYSEWYARERSSLRNQLHALSTSTRGT